jgi:hypothetical protein
MKILAVLIFALAGLVSFGANAASGAFATGEVGDNVGYGLGDNTDEASRAAVKACREEGGKKCEVILTFKKCGAYASSSSSVGTATGNTEDIAKRKAREDCGQGCKVVFSACTDD